jgi:hypothetical protein
MQTWRYAVTVRKEAGVFQFFDITRTADGQIFFRYPAPPAARHWRPHTSVHRNGQVHEKDFGQEFMPRHVCKPDASFRGTETITRLVMRPEQWANIGQDFDPNDFSDTFEIGTNKVAEPHWTHLQLDLVQPGVQPVLPHSAHVIQQGFFRDQSPWIAVTLLDASDI